MKTDLKLISVNVGSPQVVVSNGDQVSTGIFKEAVAGRAMLRILNLEGDRQADLSVHGGPSRAVSEMKLHWDMFDSLTTVALFEREPNIGQNLRLR